MSFAVHTDLRLQQVTKRQNLDFLKVHKREKFFGSDFEFFTILY